MESIRQLSIFITLNTSTSYKECKSLPIPELVDFYNDVYEYLKKQNE